MKGAEKILDLLTKMGKRRGGRMAERKGGHQLWKNALGRGGSSSIFNTSHKKKGKKGKS